MIEGNETSARGQVSLRARLRIVISSAALEEDCAELEKCIDSLDRFLRLLTSNDQVNGKPPSRKSKRVAKALSRVREHVDNLYTVVCHGWERNCHQQHEVKLRLEDRLSVSDSARDKSYKDRQPHNFELVFAGDSPKTPCLWHETYVHVLEDDLSDQVIAQDVRPTQPKVKVTFTGSAGPLSDQKLLEIPGICSAIEQAQTKKGHAAFILLATSRFAQPESHLDKYISCQAKATIPMADVFRGTSSGQRNFATASWAAKTSLALVISSSFLQLLQTPWAGRKLSYAAISFLHDSNHQPDFTKPIISLPFNSTLRPAFDTAPMADALLGLGIMLLEILGHHDAVPAL